MASNGGSGPGARPEDRVAVYGNLVAPLTDVLPPVQNSGGRSDPLVMLGQRFSDKSNDKQLRKAQEDMQKGKTKKYNALEGDLRWVSFLIKHSDTPLFGMEELTTDCSSLWYDKLRLLLWVIGSRCCNRVMLQWDKSSKPDQADINTTTKSMHFPHFPHSRDINLLVSLLEFRSSASYCMDFVFVLKASKLVQKHLILWISIPSTRLIIQVAPWRAYSSHCSTLFVDESLCWRSIPMCTWRLINIARLIFLLTGCMPL